MDTGKELIYRLYIQREEAFVRNDIRNEFSRYEDIRNGNVEKVRENFVEIKKDFFKGKGTLSKNPLRNCIYHFVVSIGVVSRICIKAGMPHDEVISTSRQPMNVNQSTKSSISLSRHTSILLKE